MDLRELAANLSDKRLAAKIASTETAVGRHKDRAADARWSRRNGSGSRIQSTAEVDAHAKKRAAEQLLSALRAEQAARGSDH